MGDFYTRNRPDSSTRCPSCERNFHNYDVIRCRVCKKLHCTEEYLDIKPCGDLIFNDAGVALSICNECQENLNITDFRLEDGGYKLDDIRQKLIKAREK